VPHWGQDLLKTLPDILLKYHGPKFAPNTRGHVACRTSKTAGLLLLRGFPRTNWLVPDKRCGLNRSMQTPSNINLLFKAGVQSTGKALAMDAIQSNTPPAPNFPKAARHDR
jgi:hypothetical protein